MIVPRTTLRETHVQSIKGLKEKSLLTLKDFITSHTRDDLIEACREQINKVSTLMQFEVDKVAERVENLEYEHIALQKLYDEQEICMSLEKQKNRELQDHQKKTTEELLNTKKSLLNLQ